MVASCFATGLARLQSEPPLNAGARVKIMPYLWGECSAGWPELEDAGTLLWPPSPEGVIWLPLSC